MPRTRKSRSARRWECPTCRSVLVAPVDGARPSRGIANRTGVTVVAAVILTALTLASGQAAIEAFNPPTREPAAAADTSRRREAVDLDVDARHLGGHEIEISTVVLDEGEPVTSAAVLAYTDMVSMPQAHTQGPIPLGPVPGEPGAYAARTKVAMVGEYVVRVSVASPKDATGETRVDVGAGVPQDARYPTAG